MCCKASSISNLTKHGAGTPSLSVILTEERIPFNVAHLSGSRRVSVGEVHRGGVELPCHGDKISPASRCRAAGNPANLSQHRLDLLTRAASDHRFMGLDGTRVPLAGPAADHQSRLFVDREKGVQVAAQVQHGPGGSRLVAMVRSRLPSNRASVVLGQPQSKCACDQKRWQIGHALACGSVEWAATALFGEPGA